jgi:hypothetical protein
VATSSRLRRSGLVADVSNAQTIYQYFLHKGLSPEAAAGFAGNAQIESSFDPGAVNQNESAIGIFQWEGGRRTALQNFAKQHGGSESSLQTQLDFAWQELNGPYKSVLSTLKYMPNAASAASEIDQIYEVSSGSSRPQRQSAASSIFSAAQSGKLAGYAGSSNAGGGATTSSGGERLLTSGGDTTSAAVPTSADYSAIDGLKNLLTAIPELKGILTKAIKSGQALPDFQDAIEGSAWWKSHGSAARQLILTQVNDPAEYKSQLHKAQADIMNVEHQLGVNLNLHDLARIQTQYMTEGWDAQTLQNVIGRHYGGGANVKGQAASLQQQLTELYGQYGQKPLLGSIQYKVRQLLDGETTIDTFKQDAIKNAISRFPGLKDQIMSGQTVEGLSQPYKQSMSNLLEIDPNAISTYDPTITRALQGTAGVVNGKSTVPQAQPLWQFEDTLRADPRWSKTQNAKDTASTVLEKIKSDWGF